MKDMLKSLRLAFLQTCGLLELAAFCALGALLYGCSVTKVEYEKNDKGEVSYRLYRNDHWLKTESTGLRGGMTDAGKFEFSAEGMKATPSEEFNRTMQTYTTAFVQLAQIAAAAYNPSAKDAAQGAAKSAAAPSVVVNAQAAQPSVAAEQPAASTNGVDCVDCAPVK